MHHIKTMNNKDHMIILIQAEKVFEKIQCPLIIRTTNKLGITETYLCYHKDNIGNNPTADIILII